MEVEVNQAPEGVVVRQRNRARGRQTWLVALLTTALLAGCGGTTASPSPIVTPSGSSPATSAAAPSQGGSLASSPAAPTSPTSIASPAPTARPSAGQPGGSELAISAVARAPADPAAAATAATAVDAFGLDLYRQLLADPRLGLDGKNAVISPTSIALALGMALAGAKGTTATQMDAVLHTSGWPAFGPGLNSLEQALVSRDASWTDILGQHTLALDIANAAYGQAGWTIEKPYLDAIKSAFGAGLRLVDFAGDPDAARRTINAWVSEQTAGRIPELLQPAEVTRLTRIALVNAIYLKAGWATPFWESLTKPAPFTRVDGSRVQMPTMRARRARHSPTPAATAGGRPSCYTAGPSAAPRSP